MEQVTLCARARRLSRALAILVGLGVAGCGRGEPDPRPEPEPVADPLESSLGPKLNGRLLVITPFDSTKLECHGDPATMDLPTVASCARIDPTKIPSDFQIAKTPAEFFPERALGSILVIRGGSTENPAPWFALVGVEAEGFPPEKAGQPKPQAPLVAAAPAALLQPAGFLLIGGLVYLIILNQKSAMMAAPPDVRNADTAGADVATRYRALDKNRRHEFRTCDRRPMPLNRDKFVREDVVIRYCDENIPICSDGKPAATLSPPQGYCP